jgi:ABC-type multidrug transport system fused ATPase/permease subunit
MKLYFKFLSEVIYIIGDNKKKLPRMVVLFILLSALDVISLGLITPYITILNDIDNSTTGISHKATNLIGSNIDNEQLLLYLGYVLLLLFLLKTILIFYVNKAIIYFSQDVMIKLRTSLMWTYQNMKYNQHVQKNTAEHVHSIQNLTSSLSATLQTLLKLISEGIVAISILFLLFFSSPAILALLSLILIGGMLIYDYIFKERLFSYGMISNIASEKMIRGITEGMTGFKDIRIFKKERYFYNRVKTGVVEVAENNMKSELVKIMPRYIFEMLIMYFIVLIVIVTILSEEDVSQLLAIIVLFGVASLRLIPVFTGISVSLATIRNNRHAVSSLFQDLSTLKIKNYSHDQIKKPDNEISFNSLLFNHVSFSYDKNIKPSVNDVSLSIYKNETIGIIGASGSGKTTLINIILGLLEPQNGQLLYNDKPLDKHIDVWRSQIAYIPQDIFLIDSTIRRNIALGVDNINNSHIYVALKQSKLLDFVESLPKGIDTYIGENGLCLSGGQRQRLALARSFYFNRNVLIMDEATSALDDETEQEIINEIKFLKGNKTIIIVAHRMSTIKNCDRIYRVQDGKIIDYGTYHDVVAKDVV